MKDIKSRKVILELKRVSMSSGGMLEPKCVVKAAKLTTSPLHRYFTWENGKAAEYWRLHQARQLIRAVVEVIDEKLPPVRVFYSLQNDRGRGGYRSTTSILDDAELKRRLLFEAKMEMEGFIGRYRVLKELTVVFRAMKKTMKRIRE